MRQKRDSVEGSVSKGLTEPQRVELIHLSRFADVQVRKEAMGIISIDEYDRVVGAFLEDTKNRYDSKVWRVAIQSIMDSVKDNVDAVRRGDVPKITAEDISDKVTATADTPRVLTKEERLHNISAGGINYLSKNINRAALYPEEYGITSADEYRKRVNEWIDGATDLFDAKMWESARVKLKAVADANAETMQKSRHVQSVVRELLRMEQSEPSTWRRQAWSRRMVRRKQSMPKYESEKTDGAGYL